MPERVVVSLSSIPPRFDDLRPTLDSLLAQDRPADAVLLWVPQAYRRFPGWDGRLPEVPDGVTILRCDQDVGPATKILPALRAYAGQDVNILFCDDDRLYRPGFIAAMLAVMAERPGCCVAPHGRHIPAELGRPAYPSHRRTRARVRIARPGEGELVGGQWIVRRSGYADLLYGYCGAMLRPDFLPPEVFDIPPVAWAVDDVWLSGNLERLGRPIWADARIPMPMDRPDVMNRDSLLDAVIDNHDRRSADREAVRHLRETYGIWKPSRAEWLLRLLRPMWYGIRQQFRPAARRPAGIARP